MTPAARISAAIDVLDTILEGHPAEQALLRWSRASRYAGSGDRAAVRDLVFDALRCRNSHAAIGGALTGRGLMIGGLVAAGRDPALFFTGEGHAPAALGPNEGAGHAEGVVDLPDWIRPLWNRSLGVDAASVAQDLRQRAPVFLRVNPLRGTVQQALDQLIRDGVTAVVDPRLPTALMVTSNERRIAQGAAYRSGLVELQDLSPQLACTFLPVVDGYRVLDYCAGGGGKVLAVAGRARGLALTAHDADPARMADLPARAHRAGIKVAVSDAPQGSFDLVIADVPCSGSGTWRRNPDAKWRLTLDELQRLESLQAQILRSAAGHVGPGGHLAYMTCSVLEDENIFQIQTFIEENPNFHPVLQRLWTSRDASDGFFLTVLARR